MTLQNKIFCYIVTMTSKRKDYKMSNTLEQLEDFDFKKMARDLNETRDGLGYEW